MTSRPKTKQPPESADIPLTGYVLAMEQLVAVVQDLSLARELEAIMCIVRTAARKLTGADGATFVLRENGMCHYADEEAIAPLWKGNRFPMNACISGWAMLNRQSAVIEDIYADPRIPHDAYRPTFVKSLAMVPIRTIDPIGAIGVYWAESRRPNQDEIKLLQALADTTAVAMENVRAYGELERRVRTRTAELEAANQALETFNDQLLREMPGTVYRRSNDKHWTIKFITDKCRDLTGYSADQLIDNGTIAYGELIHPEDRDQAWSIVQRSISENREYEIHYRILTASGDEKFVREQGRAIAFDAGNRIFVEGFISDITERRNLESEILQLQKMESLGQMTGGIAHDFNNRLAVIMGNLELLEELLNLDSEAETLLKNALDSAEGGAELGQRLLAFSRRQMLAPELVSPVSLLTGMDSLLRSTLGAAIDIRLYIPERLPRVLVDAGQLENAILNLAINARDAMPDGGTLSIRAERFIADAEYVSLHVDVEQGQYVVIEVADTGSGILPEVRERVFEPFFTTKEPGKGTGLGLSMVYGFLKQSGGHARIYSEVGFGTSVKLYLPEADTDTTEQIATTQKLAAHPEIQLQPNRILVAEDDEDVRRSVVRSLESLGYETLETSSGSEALELLRSQGDSIALLFTDVVMPGGMSGIKLAQEAQALLPGLKILLTSGFSAEHVNVGSNFPLVRKPCRRPQLAQAIRDALESEQI